MPTGNLPVVTAAVHEHSINFLPHTEYRRHFHGAMKNQNSEILFYGWHSTAAVYGITYQAI
jgi:hypothetical protein